MYSYPFSFLFRGWILQPDIQPLLFVHKVQYCWPQEGPFYCWKKFSCFIDRLICIWHIQFVVLGTLVSVCCVRILFSAIIKKKIHCCSSAILFKENYCASNNFILTFPSNCVEYFTLLLCLRTRNKDGWCIFPCFIPESSNGDIKGKIIV